MNSRFTETVTSLAYLKAIGDSVDQAASIFGVGADAVPLLKAAEFYSKLTKYFTDTATFALPAYDIFYFLPSSAMEASLRAYGLGEVPMTESRFLKSLSGSGPSAAIRLQGDLGYPQTPGMYTQPFLDDLTNAMSPLDDSLDSVYGQLFYSDYPAA